MNTHFVTESGAHYEIRPTPWDYVEIKRHADATDTKKRADNEWIRLIDRSAIVEGHPVRIEMASLAEYGQDDHDTVVPGPGTTRTTTPVVRTWKEAS